MTLALLRPFSFEFASNSSSFSFSEDPIGVERLSCSFSSVSVLLFKVVGKPEASEQKEFGSLLQKRMKAVPAMIAGQPPRAATSSVRDFKAA